MKNSSLKNLGPAASDLVVALFIRSKCFRDAIVDLAHAGFSKDQIRVAFPIEGQPYLTPHAEGKPSHPEAHPEEEHTRIWRFKQSFEHDLYRSGAEQMAGVHEDSASNELETLYIKVSLREALAALGVAEERIVLLNNEMGPDGAIILLTAGPRWREAESILQHDSGLIRTDTATEHPHFAA